MKKGQAITSIEIMIEGEILETEVTIEALFEYEWEFEDEDIQIEPTFEDSKEIIIEKIRMIEDKLIFTEHGNSEILDWEQYDV